MYEKMKVFVLGAQIVINVLYLLLWFGIQITINISERGSEDLMIHQRLYRWKAQPLGRFAYLSKG